MREFDRDFASLCCKHEPSAGLSLGIFIWNLDIDVKNPSNIVSIKNELCKSNYS